MKAETLKKAILQYAMQGKLVEQDPNDEPASVLLERIKAEKKQLIKDGKIKKEKHLPPITEDEIPYELPQGWEWVRLSEILNKICAGGDKPNNFTEFKTDKNIYPVIANGEKNDGILGYSDIPVIQEQSITVSGRGTMGFVCIREPNYIPIVRLLVLVPNKYVDIKFLKYLLTHLSENGQGTAVKQLTVPMLSPKVISLPPLAEQERIVERLEQILPLVEEYGKNEEKLSKLNSALPDKIKQSILQHAVQGKLVPQNPSDEPASELLKRIKAEKEQLIKDGKIKKEKPLPPITEDEMPFQVPDSWEWVRIGTITDVGTGTTPQTSNYEYYNGNINWISSSSTANEYVTEPDKLISQKAVDECNLRIYSPDTLIIALYGQGKTRGQITQLKIPSCINQACAAICIINKELLNLSYIKYFYKKQYNDIRSLAAGGAQPNLNVQKIKNTLIPIPPLAEQQRIVTKVEELLSVVESLKV